MKKLLIWLLLSLCALLSAQEAMPFGMLGHSAVCADGFMRVMWEDITGGETPIMCYYSINSGAWQQAAPGSVTNSEALVPYQYGQQLRYRLRAEMIYEGESIAFMNAPYLAEDAFPPTLDHMGLVGTDATGDSVMVYALPLDLTSGYLAATPSKLYISLGNAANAFPTFVSLTSYNAYMTMVMNPAAASTEVSYAMLYTFNIPGLISPGLYKLGVDAEQNPTFTRLGNIQSSVSGGKLYMACNVADLTADPDFGAWPNDANMLALVSATMRININLDTMQPDIGFADYGTLGVAEFTDNYFSAPYNTLPVLDAPVMDGGELHVSYFDANGDTPLLAQFQGVSGNVYTMYPYSQEGDNVIFGCIPDGLEEGGTFRFSDNLVNMVELPFDWTPVSDEVLPQPRLEVRMPNPIRAPAEITVKGTDPGVVKVELYNLKGQHLGVLHQGTAGSFRWDGTANGTPLANGIYLLKASNANRSTLRRFAILK